MAAPDKNGVQSTINYNEIPAKIRRRPYYVVLPGLIILIGILIPFVTAIALSFTNYSFKLPTTKFVFLKNWIALLSSKDFLVYPNSESPFHLSADGCTRHCRSGVAVDDQ